MIWSFLFSFMVGSVPTAFLYSRLAHGIDIRQHGSGNMGATNSLRVMGKKAGLTVLIIDLLKGLLPVLIFSKFYPDEKTILIIGICAILGHVYSPFVRFKGGKGIATSFGVFLGFLPVAAILSLIIFLFCFYVTRYVSLSSLFGILTFTLFTVIKFKAQPEIQTLILGLAVLLFFTHRNNMKRLIEGVENKI